MSTITLNREQARYFVDVALSASSTDDITPVICGAQVTVEEGKLRVVCTDRYRAHTALVEAVAIEGDVEVIIPRQALSWLRSNVTYFGSYAKAQQRIVIEATPHVPAALHVGSDLTVTVKESEVDGAASIVWHGKHLKGNFPPVWRVIETARDAEAAVPPPRLRLDWLSRMVALGHGGREESASIKFTASENPNRPGPVYVSWRAGGESAPYAEAVVQPNLDLS